VYAAVKSIYGAARGTARLPGTWNGSAQLEQLWEEISVSACLSSAFVQLGGGRVKDGFPVKSASAPYSGASSTTTILFFPFTFVGFVLKNFPFQKMMLENKSPLPVLNGETIGHEAC
jgi:hypothetical protein